MPIYQLGEDVATGRVFYAMRFLGRTTLQDSISEYHERREEGNEDPMLLRHLLTAFVNVCHAIGHAHSRKVIHRDLKPENVVIDSFGQVIVIDWGLAKVIDEASVESLMDSVSIGNADRTSEGQVLGTPLYMAPEQAAGRLDELDYRTDIYGLGAILFAIVTGYAPHEKTQKASIESGVGAGDDQRHRQRRDPVRPRRQSRRRSGARGDLPQGDGPPALRALSECGGAGRGRAALDGGRAGDCVPGDDFGSGWTGGFRSISGCRSRWWPRRWWCWWR